MDYTYLIILIFLAITLIPAIFFTVSQQSIAVVERFGKFVRISEAGLNMKIPFIETVKGRISLRLTQLDVVVETKTKDDVFVKIVASVQFKALKDKVYEAFYTLDNVDGQIEAALFGRV
ncbi:MAG TPA: SPFH domain-containing protein [Alphaproteobacteria bacterium]|nr:SPFH domain-containing protein [Alphaproteobacteria bacterium]